MAAAKAVAARRAQAAAASAETEKQEPVGQATSEPPMS
jgi:hypothetical protein